MLASKLKFAKYSRSLKCHDIRYVHAKCKIKFAKLITPTSHIFQPYISFFSSKNLKKCKVEKVASGCDQCVWPVGVVAGCGHWVGH